jgi:hypothetical protein
MSRERLPIGLHFIVIETSPAPCLASRAIENLDLVGNTAWVRTMTSHHASHPGGDVTSVIRPQLGSALADDGANDRTDLERHICSTHRAVITKPTSPKGIVNQQHSRALLEAIPDDRVDAQRGVPRLCPVTRTRLEDL